MASGAGPSSSLQNIPNMSSVQQNQLIGDTSMELDDWRDHLQSDSRERIKYKILDTLKRHLPYSGDEGLQELRKIAERFEEKIYAAATSQSDYLRKISLKMLTMETRPQYPNPMLSNSDGVSL
ncbi:mediator of RNA polymerase II transcription subunit 15a-like isoform X2 [Bidens hawaiensis]|uniref:mediator of RNA polymerase II transcription subunit 15a-like isoform X2 n=1 Tax=Bidens hawaiensis TaxID=980011 RepID=UPI00404B5953